MSASGRRAVHRAPVSAAVAVDHGIARPSSGIAGGRWLSGMPGDLVQALDRLAAPPRALRSVLWDMHGELVDIERRLRRAIDDQAEASLREARVLGMVAEFDRELGRNPPCHGDDGRADPLRMGRREARHLAVLLRRRTDELTRDIAILERQFVELRALIDQIRGLVDRVAHGAGEQPPAEPA